MLCQIFIKSFFFFFWKKNFNLINYERKVRKRGMRKSALVWPKVGISVVHSARCNRNRRDAAINV